MEYFIMKVDENYIAPSPNGCGMLFQRNLETTKKYLQLPKHLILSIDNHMQTVYTDLITYPNFCVTGKIKKMIELFQPGTYFKRIILYDKAKKKSLPYYLPLLEAVDCLTDHTICNPDRSVIIQAEVNQEIIGERVLFRAAGVRCNCIIARLDFIESLLRRDTVGMGLKEIQTQ